MARIEPEVGGREEAVRATVDAAGPTIGSYFRAFGAAPAWSDLPEWPPDVFALANLALDHSEAYRFAVAPTHGRRWPPCPGWNEEVRAAGRAWRAAASQPGVPPPAAVRARWEVVVRHLDTPLADLREGRAAEACEALLTLHAMADEACCSLASIVPHPAEGTFERRAWDLMERHASLARVDASRIRITPKTNFAARGITIRSLSRYLALNYESVEVRWRRVGPAEWHVSEGDDFGIVLLPWPLEVRATDFRPVAGPLDNMDPGAFGFFEFAPAAPLDLRRMARVLVHARRRLGPVHAVILPEDAIELAEVPAVERLLGRLGVPFLITGVRQQATNGSMGSNAVHLGAHTGRAWEHYQQAKHHRWCLDETQIRQYHLSRVLDPSRLWWEAIDLPVRTTQIVDIGGGATIVPLVCEDLARLDEVADLLRRVGPGLVVSLLLDGPQLPQRWPCRYASLLADEPGSAVLTLTSFAMAARSHPAGTRRSRAVAVWSEPGAGLRQIDLGPGATGIGLRLSVRAKTVWTADGRRHEDSPSATLRDVVQLRVPVQ